MRRGFTLLEVLVAIGLLSVLVGVFVFSRAGGERQVVDLDFHASALRGSQLLFATLKADFDNVTPATAAGAASPVPQPDVSFTRWKGGKLALDATHQPDTERVTYRFDRALHKVFRNNQSLESGSFDAVRFTYTPAAPGSGDTLHVEVEIVPPEYLGRSGAGTPRATFVTDMTNIAGVTNQVYDRWVSGE